MWITPVVFISIILHKYIKKTGDTRGFSFTATGIMLVPIAVTLKQVLIYYLPNHQIAVFIAGNSFLLFSYVTIIIGIRKIKKLLPRVPKRVTIYIALSFLFILFALVQKKFLLTVDLMLYFLTLAAVMYAVESSFIVLEPKKPLIRKVVIIFGLSLFVDFILKSVVEITEVPNLSTIKLISFTIRFIGAGLLFAAQRKIFSVKDKKKDLLPEIQTAIYKFLKRFTIAVIIFSIAFSLFTLMSLYFLKLTLKSDLKDYKQEISLDASKTADNLQFIISKTRADLTRFSINPDIIKLNEKGKEILQKYYQENKNGLTSIMRMDKNGTITYAYPSKESIGKNISNQPHIKKLMNTYSPVLSDPFLSPQNTIVVMLHVPVFDEGIFDGSVAVMINLKTLNSVILESQPNEHIFVTNPDGTIIISKDEDIFLKNVYTIIPKLNRYSEFIKCEFGYGLLIKKIFSLMPLTTYTVYAFVPKSDVFANVSYRILILLLLGLSFVVSLIYAIRMLYLAYEEETEKFKELAETKSEESKTLLQKLQTLVSAFSRIDINKSIPETSKELLNALLKLITRGNAGSVIIKDGDKFVFTAANGYPKLLEGKFLTQEEIMPSISNRPFIIKHIFQYSEKISKGKLKPETRKMFKEIGTTSIKSTIEAPLIVDGEYYGGIFIDNFEDENAFTEEDLKIAESFSKLASLTIRSKLLVNSLRDTEDKLFTIMESFSLLDISASEEKFFGTILNIGKKLIPQADAGSATLKKGAFYEYVAIFGYREILKKLKLRAGVSYSAKSKTATVVRDIAKFNTENLTEKELEILNKAGASGIKQSIVAPIIINGEYFGGIFLDSFKERNVFSDRDIKVVSALSKLASIFVEAHMAYKKLQLANTFNESSLKLFHTVDIKGSLENVLEAAYRTLKLIYRSTLQEIAVWGKHEGDAILIKFDGKKIQRLTISPETFNIVTSREESLFVKNGNELHPFAQAVIYSGVKNMPVFRIRFNKAKEFPKEEKEFIERFGREVINLYQTISYYTQFKEMFANYIFSIGNAIESYNRYTELHSMRVGYLSMHIASKLKLNSDEKSLLLFSAILHDVGKIGIPQEILLKPGKLDPEERKMIERHPIEGEKIVMPINPGAAKIIRHHHERWDGTGYPDKLKGEEIPLLSRIITVADVFDALTTDRPYRPAYDLKKALKIMIEERGKIFDPEILDAFLTIETDILLKKELSEKDIEEMKQVITDIY